MYKRIFVLCLYPLFSLAMDDVGMSIEKDEVSLKAFDSFGKQRLDYELIRSNGLVIVDNSFYQLTSDEFHHRQVHCEHTKFWYAAVENIVLEKEKLFTRYDNAQLLKGVVKWASEGHLKSLLLTRQLTDWELLRGIELCIAYSRAIMKTLNNVKSADRYSEPLYDCKMRVINFYKNCLMVLKRYYVTYRLLKAKILHDMALKITRLTLLSGANLKSSL